MTEQSSPQAITATEARIITEENLRGPVIGRFVNSLTDHIRAVAKKGNRQFDPWMYLAGLRSPSPTPDQRKAIKEHFVAAGFTWEEHPNPDPGHPASRPYTTLSW